MSDETIKFTIFWGAIGLKDMFGNVIWKPNPNLKMTTDEQYKHNEKAGYFDQYNLVIVDER